MIAVITFPFRLVWWIFLGIVGFFKFVFKFWWLILFLIVVWLAIQIFTDYSHGDKKHGPDAQRARDCLNSSGPDFVIKYKGSPKAVQFCYDPRTHELFIRVVQWVATSKVWQEITAYKWDKDGNSYIPAIEDVLQIALNGLGKTGYFSYIRPAWNDLNINWTVLPIVSGWDDGNSLNIPNIFAEETPAQ